MPKVLPPRVVFRVEHHESKLGPYRHDPGSHKGERALEATLSLVGQGRDGDHAHPAPSAEFGDDWIEVGERSYLTYCGFANLHQLPGFIKIVGLKSDTQLAEWLSTTLLAFIRREASAYAFEVFNPERHSKGKKAKDLFASDIRDFNLAAAKRIAQRLMGEGEGTALVPVVSKIIEEEMETRGLKIHYIQQAALRTSESTLAGAAAGSRASFAKPTGYEPTLRIGAK